VKRGEDQEKIRRRLGEDQGKTKRKLVAGDRSSP
jgi:hypothetical protein